MSQPNQRWRERRDSYRPAGEPIDTSRYSVEPVSDSEARNFVVQHHYAASYPASRLAVGLWRKQQWLRPELVGVAVFSVGVQPAAMTRWCGLSFEDGIELGRFVLLDDVPANGETWFLRRSFSTLRTTISNVRAVLAYSDPVRRVSVDGRVVLPGHIGTIYQAHNGRYVGRASSRTLVLDAAGRVISERALSKIRNEERGCQYATDVLIAAGAPPRRFGESPADWVRRALRDGPFRRVKHPGNHTYVWPLDGRRTTVQGLAPAAGPYPKMTESA